MRHGIPALLTNTCRSFPGWTQYKHQQPATSVKTAAGCCYAWTCMACRSDRSRGMATAR